MRSSFENLAGQLPHSEAAPGLIFSVGTHAQFLDDANEKVREVAAVGQPVNAENVDYFGDQEKMLAKGFWKGGPGTYVISPIDSQDKYSHGYEECTGVVAVGRDRKTGENISLLSHQRPAHILGRPENFFKDLDDALSQMRAVAEEGSIDAVILGGAYSNALLREEFDMTAKIVEYEYATAVDLLSEAIQRQFQLTPIVAGPKINAVIDSVFLDNAKRRICIMRHVGEGKEDEAFATGTFPATALTDEKRKW